MNPSASKRSLSQGVLGAALGAAMAGLCVTNTQALALVVSVNGTQYNVSAFYGSYNNNTTKFAAPAPSGAGKMPWYSNEQMAKAFASAVANLPNACETPNTTTPVMLPNTPWSFCDVRFAFQQPWPHSVLQVVASYIPNDLDYVWVDSLHYTNVPWAEAQVVQGPQVPVNQVQNPQQQQCQAQGQNQTQQGQQGQPQHQQQGHNNCPHPANVPGPLPILGSAAALGFSRKLRKRIKASNSTNSSIAGA